MVCPDVGQPIIDGLFHLHKLNTNMSSISFRQFIETEESEEKSDIRRTLGKIPQSHANLVKGFNWKFSAGNTLRGDDQHIGYIDTHSKEIAVASPWNYGREFTVLHEIAHQVYDNLISDEQKAAWEQIVANTDNKQNQSPEELFCQAYANYYAKNKITIHDHPEWNQFINNLPK